MKNAVEANRYMVNLKARYRLNKFFQGLAEFRGVFTVFLKYIGGFKVFGTLLRAPPVTTVA